MMLATTASFTILAPAANLWLGSNHREKHASNVRLIWLSVKELIQLEGEFTGAKPLLKV
jgi:hypothetical protein